MLLLLPYTEYLKRLAEPRNIADVLIVFLLVYAVLKLVRGTRAAPMAAGIAVFALLYWLAVRQDLATVEYVLRGVLLPAVNVKSAAVQGSWDASSSRNWRYRGYGCGGRCGLGGNWSDLFCSRWANPPWSGCDEASRFDLRGIGRGAETRKRESRR